MAKMSKLQTTIPFQHRKSSSLITKKQEEKENSHEEITCAKHTKSPIKIKYDGSPIKERNGQRLLKRTSLQGNLIFICELYLFILYEEILSWIIIENILRSLFLWILFVFLKAIRQNYNFNSLFQNNQIVKNLILIIDVCCVSQNFFLLLRLMLAIYLVQF